MIKDTHQESPADRALAAAAGKVASTCACFNLRKAARVATQIFDEALAPAGLGAGQFSVLTALTLAAPITLSRLANILAMDRTTLTRVLKPLIRDGLVRMAAGEDRRTRAISLTERGQEMLSAALPLWRTAHARMVRHLGQARSERLIGDLGAVLALRKSV
jgi:DNA-binding MarR family transcriptional regulator